MPDNLFTWLVTIATLAWIVCGLLYGGTGHDDFVAPLHLLFPS